MYKLTKYESETIINYNEEEQDARVYTCNRSLMSKMDKLVLSGGGSVERQDKYSKTYLIPKKYIKISAPIKRNFTDEQRQNLRERMTASRIKSKVKFTG